MSAAQEKFLKVEISLSARAKSSSLILPSSDGISVRASSGVSQQSVAEKPRKNTSVSKKEPLDLFH